jgi:hypothetical protein
LAQTTPQELSRFFTHFAFEQTGSDKHLRDARGVLVTQWGQLDLELIRRMVNQRGLLPQFEQVYEAARQEIED